MSNETKITFYALPLTFLASWITPVPAILNCVVFLALLVIDRENERQLAAAVKRHPEAEEQAAALKALGLLYAQIDNTLKELQTEVNGINLARGLGRQK